MDNLKANSIQTVFYPVTEEDNNCKNGNTNSVNACQVPKRVHHFYDVKFFSSEDRTCRFRIEELEKLINCINLERLELYKKLEERQFERNEERLRMERLLKRESELKTDLLWQKRKLLLLQHAVSKPSFADNAYRERAIRSCSSMEEETSFQARMRARNLRFHLLHGTNTLAKEREIFRETNNESPNGASDSSLSEEDPIDLIWQLYWHSWQWPKNEQVWIRQIHEEVKLLKWTKEKSIANAAAKASIWDAFGSKQTLQEKIKIIKKESEEIRKEHLALRPKIKQTMRNMEKKKKYLISTEKQLAAINQRRVEVYKCIDTLRQHHNYTKME